MLVFDPDEKPATERKTFAPGLSFDLYPETHQDVRQIRKEVMQASAETPERTEELFETRLRMHRMRNWYGVVDKHGGPLPRTPENVNGVMNRFSDLEDWIITTCRHMALATAMRRAELLKNSNGSQPAPGSGSEPESVPAESAA